MFNVTLSYKVYRALTKMAYKSIHTAPTFCHVNTNIQNFFVKKKINHV